MNRFNFIIDKLPDAGQLSSVSNSVFSFQVASSGDIQNIDLESLHKKEFYLDSFCCFSVFFNFSKSNSEKDLLIKDLITHKNLLLQLFFHPKFIKKNNRPVIFLSADSKNNSVIEAFIRSIDAYCFLQGFDGIQTNCFSEVVVSEGNSHILYHYKELADLEEKYYQMLAKEFYVAKYFGLTGVTAHGFSEILNAKSDSEKKLEEKCPAQYFLMKKYVEDAEQLTLLKEESKFLEEDLNNQKMYLQTVKNFDESKKINEFYYNEYEVLPLWYKKIGHIIKVLIGKRTFRSLFDANVKKNKS